MIDIHAHVLPLDDGPKMYLQSIEMCREAERQGITKIICTPHVLVPGFDIDKKKIEKSFRVFYEDNEGRVSDVTIAREGALCLRCAEDDKIQGLTPPDED